LYAPDFRWFVLARIIGGLSRANVSICTTIVADDSSPEWRPKGMAFIGGAFSIGFTVGMRHKVTYFYNPLSNFLDELNNEITL